MDALNLPGDKIQVARQWYAAHLTMHDVTVTLLVADKAAGGDENAVTVEEYAMSVKDKAPELLDIISSAGDALKQDGEN